MVWWLATQVVAAPFDPLAHAPIAPMLAPVGPVTIDTDGPTMNVDGVVLTGVVVDGVAVYTFGAVVLGQDVAVEGARPVAILSHDDLVLSATITASASGSEPGPGGYAGGADSSGEAGAGVGGGQVSGLGGADGGGFGGRGGSAGGGGGAPYGDLRVALDGGSGGGRSDDFCLFCSHGRGGGGGGAVELGAADDLVIEASGTVMADGAAGEDDDSDGGGGGAGGGILVHGRGGRCDGVLAARGGDGGATGWFDTEGGGGAGGRVVMLDLEAPCTADVSPGARGGAAVGEVSFQEWVPPDQDDDGYDEEVDCDDLDGETYPGAPEVPGDGIDQDCDGADEPGPEPTEPTQPVDTGTVSSGTVSSGTVSSGTVSSGTWTDDSGDSTPDRGPALTPDRAADDLAGCGCAAGGGAAGALGWLVVPLIGIVGVRRQAMQYRTQPVSSRTHQQPAGMRRSSVSASQASTAARVPSAVGSSAIVAPTTAETRRATPSGSTIHT